MMLAVAVTLIALSGVAAVRRDGSRLVDESGSPLILKGVGCKLPKAVATLTYAVQESTSASLRLQIWAPSTSVSRATRCSRAQRT